MNDYERPEKSQAYLEFLTSENGQIQQEVLCEAIKSKLKPDPSLQILDAGCGPGWLEKRLSRDFPLIQGCDSAETLIQVAKSQNPNLTFKLANIENVLPYTENFLDCVILNMAIHDLENPNSALKQIARVLKPNGQLLITLPNPYYAFPVGVWKRGILRRLLFKKPKLILREINKSNTASKTAVWNKHLSSYARSLEFYLEIAKQSGFKLSSLNEITSPADGKKFNLTYQLHRFPLLILLEFHLCEEN